MKKCIFATDFLQFVIDFLIRIQIATHSSGSAARTQAACGLATRYVISKVSSALLA